MQSLTAKHQQILLIAIFIFGLIFYCFAAQKVLANYGKLVFVPILALSGILLLLTIPLPRIFQLLIATLPLDATLVFDVGFRVQPSFLMLIFLIFIMLVSREFWYTKSPLDYAIFVYISICAMSLMHNIFNPPPALKGTAYTGLRGSSFRGFIQVALLFFYSLFYFFTVYICKNKNHLDMAIKTYLVIGIIIASYGIYQAFAVQFNLPLKNVTNAPSTGGTGGTSAAFVNVEFARFRSQATFGEPLGLGHYLLSLIPLSLAFGVVTRVYVDLKNRRWLSGKALSIITFVFLLALFMTRSRGALIGFFAALGILPLLLGLRNLKKFITYLLIAILGLAILYIVAVKYMGLEGDILKVLRFRREQHIVQTVDPSNPFAAVMGATTQRYLFYAQWVPYFFKRYPILGIGFGNFTLFITNLLNYRDRLISPTGVWGTVLAETGILGFVSFSSMIVIYYITMIRTLVKSRNTVWEPYLIGLITSFTGIIVQYVSFASRLGVYTWFLMGISMAMVNHIRKEQNANSNMQEIKES